MDCLVEEAWPRVAWPVTERVPVSVMEVNDPAPAVRAPLMVAVPVAVMLATEVMSPEIRVLPWTESFWDGEVLDIPTFSSVERVMVEVPVTVVESLDW